MPQPDLDPTDPEDQWDHVQSTILDAVDPGDLETHNCMPRLPCDSCPNSQNSKPHNSRYNSSSTNTATRTNSTTHPSRPHRTFSKISK